MAVVAIHAALLFAFLHMAGQDLIGETQRVLRLFDIEALKPPPPPPPPPQQKTSAEAQGEGGRIGAQEHQNRSDSRGRAKAAGSRLRRTDPRDPRLRARARHRRKAPRRARSRDWRGRAGTGTGSGAGGTGRVAAATMALPSRRGWCRRCSIGRDFPRDLLDQWPRGATVFLRLRVDTRGYISECTVDRASGVEAIDLTMCNLAHDRLRFRPALNRSGQAVAGWFGYAQPAPR